MLDVRNGADKLVCRIDKASKTIEIVQKGYKTTIRFLDNGQVLIKNVRQNCLRMCTGRAIT